jgi:ATP phosphoribosyltransferase
VKPADVAIYVELGAADIGVVGKDILDESNPNVYELLDLHLGNCRMCVAAKQDFVDDLSRPLRVATKFVNMARRYYTTVGREIELIKLNGSIELAPILGMSDVIFDIVETGTTLKENNLHVIETVSEISTRLVANKVAYQFKKQAVAQITERLRGVTSC